MPQSRLHERSLPESTQGSQAASGRQNTRSRISVKNYMSDKIDDAVDFLNWLGVTLSVRPHAINAGRRIGRNEMRSRLCNDPAGAKSKVAQTGTAEMLELTEKVPPLHALHSRRI